MRFPVLLMAAFLSTALLAAGTAGQEATTSGDDAVLHLEEGRAEGRWILIEYREGNDRIDRFSVDGSLYFSAIQLPGPFQVEVDGDRFIFTGEGFKVEVFDDPRGVAHFSSDTQGFSFNPAWAVGTRQDDGHVQLTYDRTTAVLTGAEKQGHRLDLANGTFLRTGHQAGVLQPYQGSQDLVLARLDALAAEGKLLGWGNDRGDGLRFLPLTDGSQETDRVSQLQYRILLKDTPQQARFMVIEFEEGRLNPEELRMRVFEERMGFNLPADLKRIDDVESLLSQENETVGYHIQEGLQGLRVIVALEPGSTHGVEVRGEPPLVPPVITFGVLAGLLTVAGGTGFFFLDKWRPRRF